MLKEHGFLVLRLPPYHCDMNIIEYVWAEIKHFVRDNNVIGDSSMSQLFILSEQAIVSVSVVNWRKYCSHIASIENVYWERDGIIQDLVESLFITLDESDDDTDIFSEDGKSEDG